MRSIFRFGFTRAAPLFFAAALLAGCIKVDQELSLNADGTGTFHVRYGMKQETISQIDAMSRAGAKENAAATTQSPFQFDEKKVRKDFETYARDGVTLDSFAAAETNDWKFIDLRMKFASLAGLMKTDFLSDRKLTLLREENGNYILEQRPDSPHVPESNADNPAVQDMMKELMKGFHAGIAVRVPGDVLESNGTASGRVVSWTFDLEQDPQALKKAQQLNMRVVFKGDGLNLPGAARPPAPQPK